MKRIFYKLLFDSKAEMDFVDNKVECYFEGLLFKRIKRKHKIKKPTTVLNSDTPKVVFEMPSPSRRNFSVNCYYE